MRQWGASQAPVRPCRPSVARIGARVRGVQWPVAMGTRGTVPIGIAVVLGALAARAYAQSNPEAEQAFRDGKALMRAQRYALACEACEASDRLEPNLGAKVSLADCYEKRGKLASAWGLFLAVATQARGDATQTALRDIVAGRIAALEPRLPFLTISVPEASQVEGLAITRNDATVDPGLWNRAVPIDAGTYVIRARAPGREPWSTTVVIDGEGVRKSIDVPRFELAVAPSAPESPSASRVASRRWLVPGALGAGAGVLGALALGFELSGRGSYADYERMPDRTELYDAANRKHHVAQGLAVAGLGCAAAAVVVWLVRRGPPHDPQVAIVPTIGASTTGVALIGGF